jgi:iron(III) transport system ATP-binding protein
VVFVIECKEVTRRYGPVVAVNAVTFAARGDTVLLGPSGSGKTTLLRLIAGLEVPDSGTVLLDGTEVSGPGWVLEPHRRQVSCMFQTPALWPHMTVSQNILFAMGSLPREEARERLDELLYRASLSHLADRYPRELSGGEARRGALVRALAHPSRFLLLDEPLLNLNLELKDQVFDLLMEWKRRMRASLVYVTHDLEEADRIAGTRLTIIEGRLSTDRI